MSTHAPTLSPRVRAALVGLLVGGAGGFLLTEVTAALLSAVTGLTVEGSGLLTLVSVLVPLVGAVLGALVAVHRPGSGSGSGRGW